MLTCRQLVSSLGDYLDPRYPQGERDRLEGHVARCAACCAYAESYRATVELARLVLRGAEGTTTAEELPEELVETILRPREAGMWRSINLIGIAASPLLLVALGW